MTLSHDAKTGLKTLGMALDLGPPSRPDFRARNDGVRGA